MRVIALDFSTRMLELKSMGTGMGRMVKLTRIRKRIAKMEISFTTLRIC